jgi:pyrroline-5-carboxylate reductase
MRIAMVGLGRMGANLVRRLLRDGITPSRSIAPDPVNFDLLGGAASESLPAGQRYCFNSWDIAEA